MHQKFDLSDTNPVVDRSRREIDSIGMERMVIRAGKPQLFFFASGPMKLRMIWSIFGRVSREYFVFGYL